MIESTDRPPIFNYVISVAHGREFIITIYADGMSQWDDLSQGSLSDRIHDEGTRSVVELQISGEIYATARAIGERERAEEARAGQFQPLAPVAEEIAHVDRMFGEFFWRHVNPVLPEPITGSDLERY